MSPTPKQPPQLDAPPSDAQDMLDEALDETFPASDPIAVHPDENAHVENARQPKR
ncbi:MAG: hypothetical protein WDN30_13265 [Pararobbsia sp.]